MFVNKLGTEHLLSGTNCQDFGFESPTMKCIVDGCSEGLHSEVGAKLFCHMFSKGICIEDIFKTLTSIFTTEEDIKNHLLFTILYLEETEDKFIVYECGDGYIIKQTQDDKFEYQEIDYKGTPPYYAYNYIDKNRLSLYKNGAAFNRYEFDKKDYKAIGIASDGLSYILGSQYKTNFEQFLLERKAISIKRLINVNYNYQFAINTLSQECIKSYIPFDYISLKNNFKDDITIVI